MEQLTPYKAPRQKRSRESLERLLDAAEAQIRAGGLESLTINVVVGRVGLSVGAFYARFPDKTALLHAVQDRFHNRLEPVIRAQMLEEAGPCEDLASAVSAAVDVLVRNVTREWELSRGFMMMSVFDPVLRARGELVNRDRRSVFRSVLLAHATEIGHPDSQLAIDVAYGMYAAVVRGRLIFGLEHELYYDVDSGTLYEELKQALTLYLRGENPPPR
jgi:AcrR family transcriptional regulator